ncbi:permease for cytosine/purines, uracil, thiamine, allantoin-domain-containing protein [Hyaloscypha finlandica]|nr:permease for cytosine/purines, uracil, thiamine, allantoin-domain-containing protein [Hyaloscypha finlandica]
MSTVSRLIKRAELPREDDTLTHEELYLANYDLLPVPVENRTWGPWTYFLFWFAEGSSITSLTTVGTAVKNGLSWWEAWLAVIFSHVVIAFYMTLTGRAGAVYHTPFPVIARTSFGQWGSYFPLISRQIMTIIWTGVQSVSTGNCFYVMLHAIFPSIAHVHNPFSSQVTMTGGRLIGFACGWVVTLACCWVPFHKFQKLVVVKSAAMLFFILAFFIWVLVRARGGGAMLTAPSTIPKGETHAWLYVSQFMIQASNQLTFATNNADITRYASASQAIYGKVLWDPIAILDGFLTQTYDSKTRCGVFFLGLGFSFAQVTAMIFANLISAGNDTAALVPRFISVKRGAIICMILAFAITPWNLTKTSFAFTSYLNSYSVFLAGFIGIIACDYFIIRKGFYDIHDLFSGRKEGIYYYAGGWNWRAFAAYLLTMVPFLPGFAQICGAKNIPEAAQKIFDLGAIIQTILSALFYWGFCVISPPPGGIAAKWNEVEPGNDFVPRVYPQIDGVSVDDVEKGDMEKQASVATGAEINNS